MTIDDCTPSQAQAIKMRNFSEEGKLNADVILSIMREERPTQKGLRDTSGRTFVPDSKKGTAENSTPATNTTPRARIAPIWNGTSKAV